jgi:hypothetical protein
MKNQQPTDLGIGTAEKTSGRPRGWRRERNDGLKRQTFFSLILYGWCGATYMMKRQKIRAAWGVLNDKGTEAAWKRIRQKPRDAKRRPRGAKQLHAGVRNAETKLKPHGVKM